MCDIAVLPVRSLTARHCDEQSFFSFDYLDIVYDNTHIENCIVESRDTIRANSYHCGEDGIKIVVEKNERYAI